MDKEEVDKIVAQDKADQANKNKNEAKSSGTDIGNIKDIISNKYQIDDYENIEETSPETFEGLILFLQLPSTKAEMMEKFRSL